MGGTSSESTAVRIKILETDELGARLTRTMVTDACYGIAVGLLS